MPFVQPGRLTRNQREIFEYLAAGWRLQAIADQRQVGRSAIESAITLARRALGGETTAETLALALDNGHLLRSVIHDHRLLRRAAAATFKVAA